MRSTTATVVLFLLAVVVIALYAIFGRSQLQNQLREVHHENESLRAQLDDMRLKAAELPKLRAELPNWRRQLKVLKAAIPAAIEDEVFFAAIADQLKQQGIELLRVDMAQSTGWLAKATEAQLDEMQKMGIDVTTAKKIQVAFYSINLMGGFDKVLAAFENLKKYGRLYSVDQVSGPAGGGGGTVTEVVDYHNTPIELTGKIFFGIPQDYLSLEQLNQAFADAIAAPVARSLQRSIAARARKLLQSQNGGSGGSAADNAASGAGESSE